MPEPPYIIWEAREDIIMGEMELNILSWDIPIPGWNEDIMGGRDGIMERPRWATASEGAIPSSSVIPRTTEKPNDRMAISFPS
jgi:hypothetical protein